MRVVMKNKTLKYLLSSVLVLSMILTIPHPVVYAGGKNPYIHIIIDDQGVKDEKYASKIIGKLKDAFAERFEHVSVHTGCGKPKSGEMVIRPNLHGMSVQVKEGIGNKKTGFHCNAQVVVEVITERYSEAFDVQGTGSADWNFLETILFLAGIVAWVIPGYIILGINDGRSKTSAVKQAAEGLSGQLLLNVLYSNNYLSYTDFVHMSKTEPARLSVHADFSDKSWLLPNPAKPEPKMLI